MEKELGHKGPTREAPPLPKGGRILHPKGALSPLLAALSSPPNLYILEDFHPLDKQVLEPPLVDLVLVLVGPS